MVGFGAASVNDILVYVEACMGVLCFMHYPFT